MKAINRRWYLELGIVISNIKSCFLAYAMPWPSFKDMLVKLAKKLDIYVIVYLDDIMIYTKNLGQSNIEVIHWVLNELPKYSLFVNLKKCQFNQDEICFLGYVVLPKKMSIEAEKIKVVKDWPKPKSVRNIQVFLDFANFYWQFIQSFSKIVAPVTLMLKTIRSSNELASGRNDGN